MAKIKLGLCIFSWFCFLLCFVVLNVACTDTDDGSSDSDQSQNPTPNPNPDANEDSELSLVLQRFAQIVGQRNREQGKVIEEMKEQIQSLQSAQESRDAEVKSLKKELDQLKNQISEDHGVWMLTPPLRGPPGKDGQTGQKGESGQKGDGGSIGPKGERGQVGPEGRPGTNGLPGQNGKGEKGEKGQPGLKGDQGISAVDLESITSCSVAMEILPSPRSQKQKIYPHGNTNKVEVLCDFETDGGGWTIIQKRSSGPKQEFSQNWIDYKNGFGSLDKNFWLGLENIHALTKNGNQELRIELEDFEGEKKWAKYSNFSISDAFDFYRSSIRGFYANSTLKDSFARFHDGPRFSTTDKDNDNYFSVNCALEHGGGGGWWFNSGCGAVNLNGAYFEKGETAPQYTGVTWYSWKGYYSSLAKAEMKIRTRK